MSDRPAVSLCLIARNEEDSLPACLTSARHLVQEIIVVDTGSTDRTREVAVQNGARVFSYAWDDDFAAARNYSLSQATGKWILVLDADEILDPVAATEFTRLLSVPGIEGYFVHIISHLDQGGKAPDQAVRLFKNHPAYRFTGAIHEQVAGSIKKHNQGGGLAFSPLVLQHYGYLTGRMAAGNKCNRNIRVIEKALAQNSTDPFLLYSLGIEYFNCGQNGRAVHCLKQALAFMEGREGYRRDLLLLLCLGLFKTGERNELPNFLEQVEAVWPADADLNLLKGLYLLREKHYGPAVTRLRAALNQPAVLPPHHIYALLGDALSLAAQYTQAAGEYFRALTAAPRMLYSLTRILALRQKENVQVDWRRLAQFAPFKLKECLLNQLAPLGEVPLALVLAVLNILDAKDPAAACRAFLQLLLTHSPNVHDQTKQYLLLTAQEMLLYAGAAGKGLASAWFKPWPAVFSLAEGCLEVLAAEFTWPPVNLQM